MYYDSKSYYWAYTLRKPKLKKHITLMSAEHSPLHQWKASRGGHLHFKEKTFSKSANTFDNNHM